MRWCRVPFVAMVLLAGFACPALGKAPNPAKFKFTLSGVQTSSWAEDRTSGGDCPQHTMRGGNERIVFATARPVTARVAPYRFAGVYIPRFAISSGRPSFQVGATIDRAQTDNTVDCTGKPVPSDPPPDCGRRQVPWFLDVASTYRRSGGISLLTDNLREQNDPFNSCLATLFTWPAIPYFDPNNEHRLWTGPVANRKFFDMRIRRFTVKASYGATLQNPPTGLTAAGVQLSWTMVLTRVR